LLKQPQYKPMAVDQQVMVIYAATQGFLDDVPVNRVQEFQNAFLGYVDASAPGVRSALAGKPELTKEVEDQLRAALTDFKAKVWKK
jgi:F-type H+/Na+-transporting ATPase subunit alpha